jgi:hypothetical protein
MFAALLAGCDPSAGEIVDYTIPPVEDVLGGADAVVLGRVVGFPDDDRYVLEAVISVEEVLAQHEAGSTAEPAPGPMAVGAYDDPCARRTGLQFADEESVLIVLRWIGPDNGL